MPASGNLNICAHCNTPYDWRRSASSSLKMTYCSSLCERAGLGFTIDSLVGRPVSNQSVASGMAA